MNTKILRVVLLVALALIFGTLWSKWQLEFNTPKPQSALVSNSASQIPNLPSSSNALAGSVSQVATANQATDKIITVRTDVLNVGINLNGGNIVNAELLDYPAELNSKQPVTLLNNDPNTLYVAQSGLISNELPAQPMFSSSQTQYNVTTQVQTIDLTYKTKNGITLVKRYTFTPGKYTIGVNYQIINNSNQTVPAHFYAQLTRIPPKEEHHMLGATFTGAAISSPSDHYQKLSFKELANTQIDTVAEGGWVAMIQHYFISAWVPDQTQNTQLFSRAFDNNSFAVGLTNPALMVAAKSTASTGATLYVGPAIADQLNAVAPYLNLTIDYGMLWFISQLLFWLLSHIHSFVGNWGWAIVILTVIIKIVFYPLSAKSYRSMARMRALQPKMTQLRERFADDRQKLSRAVMELYREEKVNPLGGCLPMIIQIPVFIALYWVLMESVELRQAPFMLWIHDLSAQDPYFVLPVLMGISMFVQQRLNPAPPDPTQAKVMMFLPIIFTGMFLFFPAGLVVYWLVNNCISILQQWWINRQFAPARNS